MKHVDEDGSVSCMDTTTVAQAIADFPRTNARTLRFSGGAPRSARVIADGSTALFLRSAGADDTVTSLWRSMWRDGVRTETLIADPRTLLADMDPDDVPEEEKARRERARESAQGIVSYSVDAQGKRVVFALNGRLFVSVLGGHDGAGAQTRELARSNPQAAALNPRISPDGMLVAYSTGSEVHVLAIGDDVQQDEDWPVIGIDEEECSYPDQSVGLAEFAAGEEMDRYDGFWWSPDSRALLVQSTDEEREPLWYISDPADPTKPAAGRRYAQALTRNALVSLAYVDFTVEPQSVPGQPRVQTCNVADIDWDHETYEYLAAVSWSKGHDPLILVQNRTQTRDQVLRVMLSQTGFQAGVDSEGVIGEPVATVAVQEHANEQWLDLVSGTPAYTPSGRVVCALNDMEADANRLTVDGVAFTDPAWQIHDVLDITDTDVLAIASSDPRSMDVVRFPLDGGEASVLNPEPGLWAASRGGQGITLTGRTMTRARSVMLHLSPDETQAFAVQGIQPAVTEANTVVNYGADPGFEPNTQFVTIPGEHQLLAAITRPSAGSPYANADKLPVLLKPYGGPGAQEVMFAQAYHRESQWWADQGFIVVTADGRGTPGRGPRWDRAIHLCMKEVTLADQVEAVRGLAEVAPDADTSRVAMIGWSYGGFLSALAVLKAPDVVHAACAGAPPTDWTLYDTHYTERYLGLDPETYRRNSIIEDAPKLRRPLMLIHGFADDNVTIAHSLRLSQALMAAGRAHTFLPLTGITHMTNDETVAENLLILQRDFLYDALQMEQAQRR